MNLRPEVRVNKLGVPVTKHVRDAPAVPQGFLSRIVPTLNGSLAKQRTAMLSDLGDDITKEQELLDIQADAEMKAMKASNDRSVQLKMMRVMRLNSREELREGGGKNKRYVEVLNGYSTLTVAAIHDAFHGTGNVLFFLKTNRFEDEKLIRASLSFRDSGLSQSTHPENVLRDVSKSLGVKDLSRIPEDSEQHTLVSAVIHVAAAAADDRSRASHVSLRSTSDSISARLRHRSERTIWMDKEAECIQMTPQLAKIIMERPDRTSDIINYIGSRQQEPKDLDIELMRLHLDNPSPSLADGIL